MTEPSTETARLANEYVRLGGKRKLKLDDNIVSTRLWDDEPQEAAESGATKWRRFPKKGGGRWRRTFPI
jgi:hypothetical protein